MLPTTVTSVRQAFQEIKHFGVGAARDEEVLETYAALHQRWSMGICAFMMRQILQGRQISQNLVRLKPGMTLWAAYLVPNLSCMHTLTVDRVGT